MGKDLVLPSASQIRWQNSEFGMFVHFGINTFNNKEWSDGTLSPKMFNPTELNTDQWVSVAKNAGIKYIILTAKHHDGFCLWQTETTDYSVKSSPYKQGNGDVVAEFVASCRKFDMKFGFYLSPWDRNAACYPDKEEYDLFYSAQLTELLTKYANHNEIFEIWFDGAGSQGRSYNWDMIMDICKKHQPDAMIFNMGKPTIRWCGNERGFATYPNWNIVPALKSAEFNPKNPAINGEGDIWLPQECDVPIHCGRWFHHKGIGAIDYRLRLFSVNQLVEIYEKSIGLGANLLLNLAPNEKGLLSDLNVKRLNEFMGKINSMYSDPIATTAGSGSELTLFLPLEQKVDAIELKEEISKGQRVKSYELYANIKGTWRPIISTEKTLTIGHRKIDKLVSPVVTDSIKVVFKETFAEPIILKFCAYSFKSDGE